MGRVVVTKVLDYGSIELVDFMGGDARVDAAAGVSLGRFGRERTVEQQRKLIRYMMKHRHGTPFEHSVFTFHIKCPMFIRTEWMRHRIGSFNEISGRYTELPMEFYMPDEWRQPDPNNKQGSVPYDGDAGGAFEVYRTAMRAAEWAYHVQLAQGIAREMARMVLPLSTYTEFIWSVNARSLMNFISLRNTLDAQYEIRVYADSIYDIFMDSMPLTGEAFTENGYTAP